MPIECCKCTTDSVFIEKGQYYCPYHYAEAVNPELLDTIDSIKKPTNLKQQVVPESEPEPIVNKYESPFDFDMEIDPNPKGKRIPLPAQ